MRVAHGSLSVSGILTQRTLAGVAGGYALVLLLNGEKKVNMTRGDENK